MDGILRSGGWPPAFERLASRNVPVLLLEGARDRVPVPGRAAELAARYDNVEHRVHPTADHELPITQARWVLEAAGLA
jgi:pimeloyl-ACP methyl ester carboxylesterase